MSILTKPIAITIMLVACAMASLTSCTKNTAPSENTQALSTDPVSEYVFNRETSKVYLTVNDKERQDITDYIVSVSDGIPYVTAEGISDIYGLKFKTVTDDEGEEFKGLLKSEKMLDTGGDLLCLTSDEYKLIFQDGNRMFTVNGMPAMLDGSCMKTEDEKYSIPLTSLTFIFGYSSLGASVNGDDIIYTIAE